MANEFKGVVEIRTSGNVLTIGFDGDNADVAIGGNKHDGDLVVKDAKGNQIFWVRAKDRVAMLGSSLPGNPSILLQEGDAKLSVGTIGNEGDIAVKDSAAREVIYLDGGSASIRVGARDNEGDILVEDEGGRTVLRFDGLHAALTLGAQEKEGDVIVRDGQGRSAIQLDGGSAALTVGTSGNEGDVIVRDANDRERIRLDGQSGDIRLRNADCAEEFDVAVHAPADPGTVVVLDDDGAVHPCREAYDRRVAGVVSGAGDLKPALVLDRRPERRGRAPLAVAGKVVCKVDARIGSIRIGDLLTTSPTPGHAMRAVDPQRAFGAVIGKALAPLPAGTGAIPILVALQ